VVADWEAEHGPLSEEELAKARRELGVETGRRRRSA
jgi:adenylosuccinate synthase